MKFSAYYLTFILLIFMLKKIEGLISVKNVVRCTRRYAAGYCDDQVKPMWTFVFQKQNCIMRMGCSASPRANRFRKYTRCMRRCKVLIDLYTQILMNNTVYVGAQGSPRRDIDGKSFLRMDITDTKDSEVYEEGEADLPSFDSYDKDATGDLIPHNIDEDTQVLRFLDGI